MSTTDKKSLKFIHLASAVAAADKEGGYDAGSIIFEPKSGRIAVSGASGLEYYGGGRIADATFDSKTKILTISFNDGITPAITLDFSDTASASGVNTILGGLNDRITALETTVGKAEADGKPATGLVASVAANATAIAAINNPSTGILAEAKKYTNDKVGDIGSGTVKDYVDTAETDAIAAAKGYADGAFDTKGSAAAAKDAAIEAANDYTDSKVSEINATTSGLRNDLGTKDAGEGTAFARIKALEGTVGDASNGLVKDVADNATAISNLSGLHADGGTHNGKKTVAEEVTAGVNAKVGDIKIGEAAVTVKAYVDAAKEAANKYTDGKVSDINAAAEDLGKRVTTLETTVNDASNGLVKKVADNTSKLTTLIGDDVDKSVRKIANEELVKQLIPENAADSLDTLTEIAAWIQSHPSDASAMNQKITALETTVNDKNTGLVKKVNDNTSSINALKGLHVDGKKVADEVTDGITGIVEHSETNDKENPKTADVVVTVTTKSGSVSGVAVDASGLRNDLGVKTAVAGTDTAFARIKALETTVGKPANGEVAATGLHKNIADNASAIKALQDAQASGSLMWSVWE